MNIFATTYDPIQCAIWLDDRRVNSQLKEACQMLSVCIALTFPDVYRCTNMYDITHAYHPCTVWARENSSNFAWLVYHGHALLAEYDLRFGRDKHHNSRYVLSEARDFANCFPNGEMTAWANCTLFKDYPIHIAYQLHLINKWRLELESGYVPKFTCRNIPVWGIPFR